MGLVVGVQPFGRGGLAGEEGKVIRRGGMGYRTGDVFLGGKRRLLTSCI